MKIYHDINSFKSYKPIVTIGTFDGVHLGHQKVINRLKEIAKIHGGESVIFTFNPHPRLVTSSYNPTLKLLTTLEEKKRLFAQIGIDNLIIFPFTKSFSELKYSEFVEKILINKVKMHCLVVGYDHHFGKNREGDFDYLKECAVRYNFKLEKLKALTIDDLHVSSTRIRNALHKGYIAQANRYLGYRFSLEGKVVKGSRIGRKIGFPTANIEIPDVHKIIPGDGVYAVNVTFSGNKYKGMLNIGTRPTFYNNKDFRAIEVHIFNFSENLYDKQITLIFVDKIRDEKKFNSTKALTEQLKKDKTKALDILAQV